MAVHATSAFSASLGSPEDLAAFIAAFSCWKEGWPKHEFSSELFGKDGSYVHPQVGGEKYKLRHVHLKPLADDRARRVWMSKFFRESRKCSDRVLVYAHNSRGDYLLIFILPEPDAHQVALMKSKEDIELMEGFAATAAAFLHDGSIIA